MFPSISVLATLYLATLIKSVGFTPDMGLRGPWPGPAVEWGGRG